ncbi:MAG: sulfite exporter TauE/SafE family protein [Firmicutes bacterium]|nr:sulfite exporter TauE/SafE family protein [Bacillota bacterium]
MQIVIFIIIGIVGGIIGGMGMGGGTLLIPLILMFTPLNQHAAQGVNLIAFVPMSIIALIIHFKNKLLNIKIAIFAAIPAAFLGIVGSIIASKIKAENLKLYFGIFLLALGVYQLGDAIYKKIKCKQ